MKKNEFFSNYLWKIVKWIMEICLQIFEQKKIVFHHANGNG